MKKHTIVQIFLENKQIYRSKDAQIKKLYSIICQNEINTVKYKSTNYKNMQITKILQKKETIKYHEKINGGSNENFFYIGSINQGSIKLGLPTGEMLRAENNSTLDGAQLGLIFKHRLNGYIDEFGEGRLKELKALARFVQINALFDKPQMLTAMEEFTGIINSNKKLPVEKAQSLIEDLKIIVQKLQNPTSN